MNGTNGLADWIGLSTDDKYKAGADWFSASGNGGLNEEGNFEISGQNYGVNINSGLAEHFPLREFENELDSLYISLVQLCPSVPFLARGGKKWHAWLFFLR